MVLVLIHTILDAYYADDIMLVSHSVYVMQLMLVICSEEAVSLDFTFNTKKSVALRVGSRYKESCIALVLCDVQIQYVQEAKYLGVMLVSARSFRHSISHVKVKFYRCFNAMYYRSRNARSECSSVQLLKSLCLPVILYSVEALQQCKSTSASLVFRIFGCSMTADIKYIRDMFGLSPVSAITVRIEGMVS